MLPLISSVRPALESWVLTAEPAAATEEEQNEAHTQAQQVSVRKARRVFVPDS